MSTSNCTVSLPNPNRRSPKFGRIAENTSPPPNKNFHIYSGLYNDSAHLHKFGEVHTVYHPAQITKPNSILILHGGEDISPAIYGHKLSKRTHATEHPSQRDAQEIALAHRAIELGIPIFGICRGAQLACALAGGSLIQDVSGHGNGIHEVVTTDGAIYNTTSCHHQMMNPEGTNFELLAWTPKNLSNRYVIQYEEEISVSVEPEVIFFPKIKALAIQGHPEWMSDSSSFVQYCLTLIQEKLLKCNSTVN